MKNVRNIFGPTITVPGCYNYPNFNPWFPLITIRTHSSFSSTLRVKNPAGRENTCRSFRPNLKWHYQYLIWALLIQSFLKAFLIIWLVFSGQYPNSKQNSIDIRHECDTSTNPLGCILLQTRKLHERWTVNACAEHSAPNSWKVTSNNDNRISDNPNGCILSDWLKFIVFYM